MSHPEVCLRGSAEVCVRDCQFVTCQAIRLEEVCVFIERLEVMSGCGFEADL